MEVNVGDRVSIDSLKVGQPRRVGTVEGVEQGLSGVRYLVRWDDGISTSFSPSGGNLIIERRARKKAQTNSKTKAKPKAKAKPKTKAKAKRTAKSRKAKR